MPDVPDTLPNKIKWPLISSINAALARVGLQVQPTANPVHTGSHTVVADAGAQYLEDRRVVGASLRRRFRSNVRSDAFALLIGETGELLLGDSVGHRWLVSGVQGSGTEVYHLGPYATHDGTYTDLYLAGGTSTQDPDARLRTSRTSGVPTLELAVYGPGGPRTAVEIVGGSSGPLTRFRGRQQTDFAAVALGSDQTSITLPNAGLIRFTTASSPSVLRGLTVADVPAGLVSWRPFVNDGPNAITLPIGDPAPDPGERFAGPADVVIPPGSGGTFARFGGESVNRCY